MKSQQQHQMNEENFELKPGTASNFVCETRTMGMQDDGGGKTLNKPEMIWEEDSHSGPSRTSSTSGYRENCSLLMMPMGSSDENSSSPVHHCLTNSSSTIIPIESPESSQSKAECGDRETRDDIAGSQQTIVTAYEHEDTLL